MSSKTSRQDDLRATFRERAIEPDSLFLLNSQDALEFIQAGKAAGLQLAGVDGIRITPQGAFEPRQEYSYWRDGPVTDDEVEVRILHLIETCGGSDIYFEIWFMPDEAGANAAQGKGA